MSALNELKKIKTKTKRRLGQGHGSGSVKTSGRGTKGQRSRNKCQSILKEGDYHLLKDSPSVEEKARIKYLKINQSELMLNF